MDNELIYIFNNLKVKIEDIYKNNKYKDKFLKEITSLEEKYKDINVEQRNNELISSLVKRGRELLRENNIKDKDKIEYYLRYCNAAVYDLNNNLKPLNKLFMSYMIMCICFMILSPQYFTFIMPIIFLLPIYLGIKGLKGRRHHGLVLSLSVVPVALLTSTAWMRNTYMGSKNFGGYISTIAESYNISETATKNMIIIFTALSVVLLISAVSTLTIGIKHKKMFI